MIPFELLAESSLDVPLTSYGANPLDFLTLKNVGFVGGLFAMFKLYNDARRWIDTIQKHLPQIQQIVESLIESLRTPPVMMSVAPEAVDVSLSSQVAFAKAAHAAAIESGNAALASAWSSTLSALIELKAARPKAEIEIKPEE